MIEYTMYKRFRLYHYKGKKLGRSELSLLEECVVNQQNVSNRMNNAIKNPHTTMWDSVEKVLTTPLNTTRKGAHKLRWAPKPGPRPKPVPIEIDESFIGIMMMMPVNDSQPKILQGKSL